MEKCLLLNTSEEQGKIEKIPRECWRQEIMTKLKLKNASKYIREEVILNTNIR